jgi:hypothetical protein
MQRDSMPYLTVWNSFLAMKDNHRLMVFGKKWKTKTYTLRPESGSELYRSNDRRLSAKLVQTFEDRECQEVGVTDPYGRILGSLERSRCIFFQVAPQLYSQGWVDPVPGPLPLRKSGGAGNRTRTSGSADGWICPIDQEAVYFLLYNMYKFSSYLTGNTIHLRSVARNSDH